MKILLITIIALVIPVFFALIFLSSTYNRLTTLRRRCHEAGERLDAATAKQPALGAPESGLDDVDLARQDHRTALVNYESARRTFSGRLVASLFGFRSV